MKRILLNMISAALLAATVSGCGGGNKMNMTAEKDKVVIGIIGSGKIAIDWGDGTVDKGKLTDAGDDFSHGYGSASPHTITVSGKNITGLNCSENQLTELDVSRNTALIILSCENNLLTVLDVSKNTALIDLDCSNNKLDSLNIIGNTALKTLNCAGNRFDPDLPYLWVRESEGKIAVTALPIVYQKANGTLDVLPYLDLTRKNEVAGIYSGRKCVSLINHGRKNWNDAMQAAKNFGNGWELPNYDDEQRLRREWMDFDATVEVLKRNNVDAMPWGRERDGDINYLVYWTGTDDTEWSAYSSYGLSGQASSYVRFKSVLCNTRYVRPVEYKKTASKVSAVKKDTDEAAETGTVKTALPVVYQLRDGSTKVLPHLDLSLKNRVIGIWSGGLCVHLQTYRGDWVEAIDKTSNRLSNLNLDDAWELPSHFDVPNLKNELDAFNKTVHTLKENKIDADPWRDVNSIGNAVYYWLKEPRGSNSGSAYLYSMRTYGGVIKYSSLEAYGTYWKGENNEIRYVRRDIRR
jgi:hypothetical protein